MHAAEHDPDAVRELGPPRSPLPPLKPRRVDVLQLPTMPLAPVPRFDRRARNPIGERFNENFDFGKLGRRW